MSGRQRPVQGVLLAGGGCLAYGSIVISATSALTIEGGRVRMPASAWEHDGFRRWVTSDDFPADVRAAFVRGEVFVEMSPDSIESHNKVKTAVTAALEWIVQDEDLGEVYSDRALLTHPAAELSTEPDVMFASWTTLESGKLRLLARAQRGDDYVELAGTPDVVVEIVSDSSERKDLVSLREAYARARIPEYWIIDARGAALRFDILSLGEGGYLDPDAVSPRHSHVLGRSFVLHRERNRVGRWRYRLDVASER